MVPIKQMYSIRFNNNAFKLGLCIHSVPGLRMPSKDRACNCSRMLSVPLDENSDENPTRNCSRYVLSLSTDENSGENR